MTRLLSRRTFSFLAKSFSISSVRPSFCFLILLVVLVRLELSVLCDSGRDVCALFPEYLLEAEDVGLEFTCSIWDCAVPDLTDARRDSCSADDDGRKGVLSP